MLGKIDRAIALCDEAIQGFDAISVTPHPLALALRTARSQMVQITADGSLNACPFQPEKHNASFLSILFRVCDDSG